MNQASIAIVGMAARLPGAPDIETFWQNVRAGLESIARFEEAEMLEDGVRPALLRDPHYVPAAGIIDGVRNFDAGFFGYGPRDAALIDPQHRHFLECAWHALENAGHDPARFDGAIGVFASSGMNSYLQSNLLTNPALIDSLGMFLVRHTGNDKDFLATEVSYHFNLRGPSINVQTACSSSLVAVHLASQALLNGECDMALAGGVTLQVPHRSGYLYRDGEILSPDGTCRPFDAHSAGTVFSSGAGVVVLRRLEDALADGDTIYAVIEGSAVNNDGAGKVGYLAPSVDGHASAIAEALAVAGLEPSDISYFEAHGTGTLVGDAIEVAAITEAFGPRVGDPYLALGATKANIGHTDTAAGVASLIKVAQALTHAEIPPLANYTGPNPEHFLDRSPLYVPTQATHWESSGRIRRAGVSSLGVGGTNAHLVVAEPPARARSAATPAPELLVLSARTDEALDQATRNLAEHLRRHPETDLADVAFTLQSGRAEYAHRRVLAATSASDVRALVDADDPRLTPKAVAAPSPPEVVFMFPGGGAQYPNMGRDLYEHEPVYRAHLDECLVLLGTLLDFDLKPLLFPDPGTDPQTASERLAVSTAALPAIFATEYALAQLWLARGVEPVAMTGHSMGEYVAACLAGVMTLRDALSLIVLRARLFERVTLGGGMLSTSLSEAEAAEFESPEVSIATINAPNQVVLSGSARGIEAIEKQLALRDVQAQRLPLTAAAHSPMLDPILAEFHAGVREVALSAPQRPFISNLTGTWITTAQATDPAYWVRHLRETVRFADGLQEILATGGRVLVEVGPGQSLRSLSMHAPVKPLAAISSLRHRNEVADDLTYFLRALGQCWANGVPVDWTTLHGGRPLRRVPLPGYPFAPTPHWIDPGANRSLSDKDSLTRIDDVADWFTRPVWRPAALPPSESPRLRWLLVHDDAPLDRELISQLERDGQDVISVRIADRFRRLGPRSYLVDSRGRDSFRLLMSDLSDRGLLPGRIVHTLLAHSSAGSPRDAHRRGFLGVLHLVQALASVELPGEVRMAVVSAGMQQVGNEPAPSPEKATVLGVCRVAPRELPGLTCVSIDLDARAPRDLERSAQLVLAEAEQASTHETVAIRDGYRWVQDYEAVPHAEPVAGGLPLRHHGVYLLTGGLGGLGLEFASYLARDFKAKLVLTSRADLPPREDWDDWVQRHGPGDDTASRIVAVRALESAGAEVVVAPADVTDEDAMRRVVRQATKRFGQVHGVVHAAGVLSDAPLLTKDEAGADSVLGPKVQGALVLDRVFERISLDFMVLFSSTSASLGPKGQVDYTGANAFLDAFARARDARAPGRTLSLAWGAWRDVGMAARAAGVARHATPARTDPLHPLLGSMHRAGDGHASYLARLSDTTSWVLDDHRMTDGIAVMPGSGIVEMVRAAASVQFAADGSPIEIRNLYFLSPMAVRPDTPRELSITLARDEGRWRFALSSRHSAASDDVELHAEAEVAVTQGTPGAIPLAEIQRRVGEPQDIVGSITGTGQDNHLAFGPGWHALRTVAFGDQEALAHLELPADAPGLDEFGLHPALLDLATGFALPLVPGYDPNVDFFVPVSYRKLVVFGPLPANLFSHARLRGGSVEHDANVTFDVTLVDPDGRVLAEVEGFSMRRLPQGGSLIEAELRSPVAAHAAPVAPLVRLSVTSGITPAEGVDAFLRALTGPRLPSLIVSPIPLAGLRALVSENPEAHVGEARVARPELAGALVGPRDEVEQTLIAWWQDLLGIAEVGIHDDFFDLGGHSLIAVRFFSRVAARYETELSLSTLFTASTVAGIAELLRGGPVAEAVDAPPVAAAPTETVAARVWDSLVPITRTGSNPPFFCVHGKGGHVIEMRELADALGPSQPFWGLQARGLNGVETPHERIEDMAAYYIAAMKAVQPEGPYHIGGYSGGGVVAYEMAHQLQALGDEVAFVAFIDTWHPGLKTNAAYPRMVRLVEATRERGLGYGIRRLSREVAHALRLGPAFNSSGDDRFHREQIGFVDLSDSFLRASAAYRPQPYAGRVLLFRAPTRAYSKFLGWERCISREIELHVVEGDHLSMMDHPNVGLIADELGRALRRAGSERTIEAVAIAHAG